MNINEILAWIVFGLIVGIIANFIIPGKGETGLFGSVILGIVGAFVGGWLAATLNTYTNLNLPTVSGFSIPSIVVSVIGALIVIFAYRKVTGN